MKSQSIDHILLKKAVSTTSMKSLVEGYILNCRCENKSKATIENYQNRLHCFLWFCQENGYPFVPETLS
jgi:hypothetical protein